MRRVVGRELVFVADNVEAFGWRFPDPLVSVYTSLALGRRGGTGLYRKKSSGWAVAGSCLFRAQKNQSEKMTAMRIATPPPTAPPTMAPKLLGVEGAAVAVGGEVLVLVLVLVGVLVD